MEREGRGEHGLKPDRPKFCLREGQTLGIGALRIVRGDDDIDRAVGDALDQCAPIFLGAKWRRKFEKGAIGTDIEFIEREMMD